VEDCSSEELPVTVVYSEQEWGASHQHNHRNDTLLYIIPIFCSGIVNHVSHFSENQDVFHVITYLYHTLHYIFCKEHISLFCGGKNLCDGKVVLAGIDHGHSELPTR
jgi:hypothetical protein